MHLLRLVRVGESFMFEVSLCGDLFVRIEGRFVNRIRFDAVRYTTSRCCSVRIEVGYTTSIVTIAAGTNS